MPYYPFSRRPNETKEYTVSLLGQKYPIKGPNQYPCIRLDFCSLNEFCQFPWEQLPDAGFLRWDGKIVIISVSYPGRIFSEDELGQLKKRTLQMRWEYQNPNAAMLKWLEDNRIRHEQKCTELRRRLNDGSGEIILITLSWNKKKQSWQGSRKEGYYDVIYTVNEKDPSPYSREPGEYYCQLKNTNVVHHEPTSSRRGFRLNVISPIERAYDTDQEMAKVREMMRAGNP